MIADYETTISKEAFKAGADVVIGGHQHVAKGVRTIGDRVCFHGTGNFFMAGKAKNNAAVLEHYGIEASQVETNPYSADGNRGIVAKLVVTQSGLESTSFLPVLIDELHRPEFLKPGDPRFDEALAWYEWASEGMPHKFEVGADGAILVRGVS
jgi:poly-gamma-glutamate synthesis protein (capsule biosynthesis protein)